MADNSLQKFQVHALPLCRIRFISYSNNSTTGSRIATRTCPSTCRPALETFRSATWWLLMVPCRPLPSRSSVQLFHSLIILPPHTHMLEMLFNKSWKSEVQMRGMQLCYGRAQVVYHISTYIIYLNWKDKPKMDGSYENWAQTSSVHCATMWHKLRLESDLISCVYLAFTLSLTVYHNWLQILLNNHDHQNNNGQYLHLNLSYGYDIARR